MWRLAVTTDAGKADVYAQALEPMASVVSIYEIEPDYPTNHKSQPEEWATDVLMSGTCVVEALFEVPPTTDDLTASLAQAATALREALPPFSWERLEDQDWVRLSQSHHPAIVAGKVLVRPSHVDNAPPASVAIKLDAGRAFGTGGHCTTYGCLMALQKLHFRPQRIVDIGTGSGLLAIAAAKLFRGADVFATEIDPRALEVAAYNIRENGVRVRCVLADGWRAEALRHNMPFDLIIENLLYRPLLRFSRDTVRHLAPGGRLIMAGLLGGQERPLLQRFRQLGLILEHRSHDPEWPCLVLRKPGP
ncbi:MAG TPA: 50S ribosomal protein L11 methyltransferase [Alphaproteobacteria bacterium]|nr:50S ribosomal protein L11 methyltransferase [Alphaproteobacteria bacterium]